MIRRTATYDMKSSDVPDVSIQAECIHEPLRVVYPFTYGIHHRLGLLMYLFEKHVRIPLGVTLGGPAYTDLVIRAQTESGEKYEITEQLSVFG